MKILFNVLLITICVFTLFTCKDDYFTTTYIPRTTEPVYTFTSESDTLEIGVLGDAGSGTQDQYDVASWMKTYKQNNSLDFVIYLGDNFYEQGVSSVEDPLFQSCFENVYTDNLSDINFYTIVGNHDFKGSIDAEILYTRESTHWKMPYLYYNYVYYLPDNTKIELFAIDTNIIVDGNPLADDLYEWLIDVLTLSDADWKIVYGHHPIYSNGSHGNTQVLIDELKPILEDYSVDVYACGHEHDLQIIKPINGVHFLVSGAGGKVRDTSSSYNTLYAKGTLGFMTLQISNSDMRLRVIIDNGDVDYEEIIVKE